MRSPSLAFLLVVPLLLAARVSAAAAEASGAPHQARRGAGGAQTVEDDAFYRKVGNFAVVVYCLWHGISPVLAVECVVSASTTRPAPGDGRGVDYLLVLRVAGLGTCRALVWGVPGEGSQDWKLKYFELEAH